jgi:hypothetical protein
MTLIEYIKDKNGKRIGVVVGVAANCVGWSLCKKCDRFDREMALTIAVGRAWKGCFNVPHTIQPYFNKMVDRSCRYYTADGYDGIPF